MGEFHKAPSLNIEQITMESTVKSLEEFGNVGGSDMRKMQC